MSAPFQINQVFRPLPTLSALTGPVRLLAYDNLKKVALIRTDPADGSGPFHCGYDQWVGWLQDGLERITDPYEALPNHEPRGLTPAQSIRYKDLQTAIGMLPDGPTWLLASAPVAQHSEAIAATLKIGRRQVSRYLNVWLKSGGKCSALVRDLPDAPKKEDKRCGIQTGAKRGVEAALPDLQSDRAGHDIIDHIERSYTKWIKQQGTTWSVAYIHMLQHEFNVPIEYLKADKDGTQPLLFLSPALIQKYRPPTLDQFKYRVRKLVAADKPPSEAGWGSRGKATDGVHGPGWFEIDATFFQIQLKCRITKRKLVGRPCVYLIVDVWSGAIVGFHLTLENPSWAAAAMALHNCYTDKGEFFKKHSMNHKGQDWPCKELPVYLRSDRAEFVSNMGVEFAHCGVHVRVSPSRTPEAKGTVEGKHGELKHSESMTRFNLPGLYKKHRERGEPDGKWDAAVDMDLFREIMVDVIMDLNRIPVGVERIPPELTSLPAHEAVRSTSRIGLYEWGLRNRPGFTFDAGPNFVFEHLLHKHNASMTPTGILFKHQFFQCDYLIDANYAQRALNGNYRMEIRYSPNNCDEVFFFDSALQRWIVAKNSDARLRGKGYSFKEAWQFLAVAKLGVLQAVANRVVQRDATAPALEQKIAQAKQEAKQAPAAPKSRAAIRHNRTAALHQERQGSSWAHHAAPAPTPAATAHTADGDDDDVTTATPPSAPTPPPSPEFKRAANARFVD